MRGASESVGGSGNLTTEANETENPKAENPKSGDGVRIVGAVEDLLFRSRIAEAAASLGVEAKFPRSPKKLMELLHSGDEKPDVLVLDLHSARFDAVAILDELNADEDEKLRDIETIGYVPHTRKDLIVSARKAGCGRILARSAFFGGLPGVLLPKRRQVGEAEVDDEL